MKSLHTTLFFCALPYVLGSHGADTQQHVLTTEELAHLVPLDDIPAMGFGTWNIEKTDAQNAVSAAIEAGYRHIDCAATYGNEKEVGAGIAAGSEKAGINRHEYWVTSKLWNDAHDPEQVPKALNQTLKDLGLEYLDLYLMHWPVADKNGHKSLEYLDTWEAMAKLPKSLVRNIGVSNFAPAQLTSLIAAHPLSKPYLHQFEAHPYLPQASFLGTHKTLGIKVTAYSPLGNTNPTYEQDSTESDPDSTPALVDHAAVAGIAEAHDCTPAQVVLAWGMKRGCSVLPKSTNVEHIKENFATDAQRCINDEDAQKLAAALPVKRFNNPSTSWGVSLFEGLDGVSVEMQHPKDETLLEHAEELALDVAKWSVMGMWAAIKGACWFAFEMLGDDGF